MIEKEKVARPEGIEPPTLCLEGRRSIRLSYGRAGCNDSKSFIAGNDTILEALTFYRRGRRSIQLNYACTAQPLSHRAGTATSSTAPLSILGPCGPDKARSDGISQPKAIRQV